MKSLDYTKNVASLSVVAYAIVSYREPFYTTPAFLSLIHSIKAAATAETFPLFIYDNTDLPNWNVAYTHPDETIAVHYHLDSSNAGISVAYNRLAKAAQEKGCKWIVFLDQDTELPANAVAAYQAAIVQRPEIPIKTIQLLVNGKVFSPSRYFLKGGHAIRSIEAGAYSFDKLMFVNSGMMVQLALFFRAGGYNESVKLDFADFLFLERIKPLTPTFQLLPVVARHSFSINETDVQKALQRYRIFIKDLANCPRQNLMDTFGYGFVGWKHLLRLTLKFRTLEFLKLRLNFER